MKRIVRIPLLESVEIREGGSSDAMIDKMNRESSQALEDGKSYVILGYEVEDIDNPDMDEDFKDYLENEGIWAKYVKDRNKTLKVADFEFIGFEDKLKAMIKEWWKDGDDTYSEAELIKQIKPLEDKPVVRGKGDLKEDYSAQERKDMVAKGHAMAGGRYPIANEEDLHKAVKAVGRSTKSSEESVRKFIMKRAKELGKESVIPDTWKADGTLKESIEEAKKGEDTIEDYHSEYVGDEDTEQKFWDIVSKYYTPKDDGESEHSFLKNVKKSKGFADMMKELEKEMPITHDPNKCPSCGTKTGRHLSWCPKYVAEAKVSELKLTPEQSKVLKDKLPAKHKEIMTVQCNGECGSDRGLGKWKYGVDTRDDHYDIEVGESGHKILQTIKEARRSDYDVAKDLMDKLDDIYQAQFDDTGKEEGFPADKTCKAFAKKFLKEEIGEYVGTGGGRSIGDNVADELKETGKLRPAIDYLRQEISKLKMPDKTKE
jgi:hypothetical protein